MIFHLDLDLIVLTALHLMLEVAALDADAVAEPLRHELLVFHVDELIFDGGRTRVDDQNFHRSVFLSLNF